MAQTLCEKVDRYGSSRKRFIFPLLPTTLAHVCKECSVSSTRASLGIARADGSATKMPAAQRIAARILPTAKRTETPASRLYNRPL
ncbi:hypothetical protein LEMLEM_LOCUS14210 [Lemmus lemmus]